MGDLKNVRVALQKGWNNMLLTILMVVEQCNQHKEDKYKKAIQSSLAKVDIWEGNYEIVSAVISNDALDQAVGQFSTLNAMLIHNGYLEQCSGKYIWILPYSICMEAKSDILVSIFHALSMGVCSVGLYSYYDNSNQKKVELVNSALELLPVTQQFDEFRYIALKDSLNECFAKGADFNTMLVYLSSKASNPISELFIKIPFQLVAQDGLGSNVFHSLSYSFFSDTRPWHRDTLILSRCFFNHISQTSNKLSPVQRDILIHLLFSCCSAMVTLSRLIFSENSSGLIKSQAYSFLNKITAVLDKLSELPSIERELSTQIEKLSYFINYWQKVASKSTTIDNTEVKENIFDGVFWLGEWVKNDLNTIGEKIFLNKVGNVRTEIERSLLNPLL